MSPRAARTRAGKAAKSRLMEAPSGTGSARQVCFDDALYPYRRSAQLGQLVRDGGDVAAPTTGIAAPARRQLHGFAVGDEGDPLRRLHGQLGGSDSLAITPTGISGPITNHPVPKPGSPGSFNGNFTFVDGHAYWHRWRNASTMPPARPDAAHLPKQVPQYERADLSWVLWHTSVELPDDPAPADTAGWSAK